MTPLMVDPDGRATIASAEGQAALDRGNTELAREKHAEAASIIEENLARATTEEERSLNRFLTATQYYKGGDYQKAYALARNVRKGDLTESVAKLLAEFLREAAQRAVADYVDQVEEGLNRLWRAKNYQGVIELLQDHPYAFAPRRLAMIRGMCCEGLGKWRPAALFFRDAHEFERDDPTTLSALAPLPLQLVGEGKVEEAWQYVKEQVDLFPNTVSHALAAILCYQRGRNSEGDARAALFEMQDRYFDLAREEFTKLPSTYQDHVEIRAALGLGYETSALRLFHSGSKEAALKRCEESISFDPTSSNGWAIKGFMLWPTDDAVVSLTKAAELGDKSYMPYYYLAHAAMTRGD
jgi:tetratricopeptide (TPR) repeat protein